MTRHTQIITTAAARYVAANPLHADVVIEQGRRGTIINTHPRPDGTVEADVQFDNADYLLVVPLTNLRSRDLLEHVRD